MSTSLYDWSTTAASNANSDAAINWAENQLPGTVNGSARAMMAAVARFLADFNGTLTTGGSSNTYTLAAPNTSFSSLSSGIIVSFKANHTNTSTATLNLSAIGAKAIVTADGGLSPGQITAGGHYTCQYDAALDSSNGAWILLNPSERVGVPLPYFGSSAPPGYAFPYGQAISRTDYPAAFAVYGTTYGAGNGTTTFNLPNLEGRGLFGKDNMSGVTAGRITNAESGIVGTTLGATGGAESVTLSTAKLPSHTHTGTTATEAAHTHTGTTGTESQNHTHSGTTGSQSVNHTHSGTTATESQGHTHTFSGTTAGRNAAHAHTLSVASALADGSGATGPYLTTAGSPIAVSPVDIATGTESADHAHNYSGTTASPSVSHTHTVTTGTESQNHTHTITTGTESVAHTHSFTSSAGSAHSHTFTSDVTGSGESHNNMPPAMVVNFIVRVC